MTAKSDRPKKAEATPSVREFFDAKNRMIRMNNTRFCRLKKGASDTSLRIFRSCLRRIRAEFEAAPWKERNAVVFRSDQWNLKIDKEDVLMASRLLRHEAVGFKVRVSTRGRDGRNPVYVITYYHWPHL